MNRNYRSSSPDEWGHAQQHSNNQFGCGNFRNLGQYANQASTSSDREFNYFSRMSQQDIESGEMGPLFRQWLHAKSASMGQLPTSNGQAHANDDANETETPYYENINLKMDLLNQFETMEYQRKLVMRQMLPVVRQRNLVAQSLKEHQVVLIVGDKGCGKSSQVPQVLLDDYILDCRGRDCRIICAQYTKMEAVELARRVASERNETVGTSVGFMVRGESCFPRPNGSILYTTNGFLLRQLREDSLQNFNVCILDSSHENNSYTTHIMQLLKQLLLNRHDLRVILLSNDVLEDTFCKYFRDYYVHFIHGSASTIDLTGDDSSGENLSSSDEVTSIDLPDAPVDNAGEQANQKNAKKAYNNARVFMKEHRHIDPSLLTEERKQMIQQHQEAIQYYKRTYSRKAKGERTQATGGNNRTETCVNDCGPSQSATTAAGVSMKRSISMDEAFMESTTTMFGDNNEELQIAVLDLSDKKGRISRKKWLDVEAKLIFDMTKDNRTKDEISFEKVNWYRGIKLITCHNVRTLEFLKKAISEVSQRSPETNLKVVPRSTIPFHAYATVWIPPPIPPMESILQLIKKQNDGLNTENWKITALQKCKKNFGKEYSLVIDRKSMTYIQEKQGKIKFGLGSIRIRIYGH